VTLAVKKFSLQISQPKNYIQKIGIIFCQFYSTRHFLSLSFQFLWIFAQWLIRQCWSKMTLLILSNLLTSVNFGHDRVSFVSRVNVFQFWWNLVQWLHHTKTRSLQSTSCIHRFDERNGSRMQYASTQTANRAVGRKAKSKSRYCWTFGVRQKISFELMKMIVVCIIRKEPDTWDNAVSSLEKHIEHIWKQLKDHPGHHE